MDTVKTLDSLNLEKGALIAHRYEVCERIGTGGMGQVFRVVDRELNDEVVALKLLHPHLAEDQNVFRRFRNEVSVARALSHPNIVRTHDIGRAEEGFLYISMEFVDGESLKDKLIEPGETQGEAAHLPFEDAVGILIQILSGVAYAHGKGVIHRDLKPANVLLSCSGEVKLADFGTARILGMDTSITRTGQVIGTPDYMSPEQIRGANLDQGCDIYSLGMIAYELVAGQKPFPADSAVAVAFKHLNDPLPNFSDSVKNVPQWYEEATRRAAAKDKEDRFPSAAQFAGAIFEHMPELAVQTGFFSIEGTNFFRTGSQGVSAKLPEAVVSETSPPSQTALPSGNGSAVPAEDTDFKLGTPSSSASDSWQLGTVRGEPESVPPSAPQTTRRRQGGKTDSASGGAISFVRLAGVLFGILVFLCAVGIFAVRSHQGLNTQLTTLIDSWGGLSGQHGKRLVRVLNLNTRSVLNKETEQDPGKTQPADEMRDGLNRELTQFVSTEESAAPSGKEKASSVPDAKLQVAAKSREGTATDGNLSDWRTGALPLEEKKGVQAAEKDRKAEKSSVSSEVKVEKSAISSSDAAKSALKSTSEKTADVKKQDPDSSSKQKSEQKASPKEESQVAKLKQETSSSAASEDPQSKDQATAVAKLSGSVDDRLPSKQGEQEKQVDASSSSAPKEEQKETPISVDPITASLAIRRGSEVLPTPSVSVDALQGVSWIASVSNLKGNVDDFSESGLRKAFHLNVFDEKSTKVIARLTPSKIARKSATDGSARVSGTFGGLKRVNPDTGKYRVDLVLDGEVVAYHSLSLFKARVSFGLTGGRRQVGGSAISIVRGPTVVNPKEKDAASNSRAPANTEISPSKETSKELAAITSQPLPTPLPGLPSESDLPVNTSRLATGSTRGGLTPSQPSSSPPYAQESISLSSVSPSLGGLPPARMPVSKDSRSNAYKTKGSATGQRGAGDVQYGTGASEASSAGVSNPALAASERYQGTFSFSLSDTAPAERRPMVLSLSFQGSKISGQGNIRGFEPFVIKGSIYPRGLEIQLQNQDFWIRLTGVRRNQTLRGRYFFPAKNKRGSWEVSRSNY